MIIGALVLVSGLLVVSPLFPYLRSLLVMRIYSSQCEKESLAGDAGLALEIPGGSAIGRDWYPFVMCFSDDTGFSAYCKEPGMKLTIYYNFPAFSMRTGASRLYDETSPYYNAFYGAYLVRRPDGGAYGMTDAETIDPEAVKTVASFDYSTLVLADFGLSPDEFVCETSNVQQQADVDFAESSGWVRLTGDLLVSGAAHNRNGFVTSYLQYGSPKDGTDAPFSPTKMKALIYAKYDEEHDVTIFFYAMAADRKVLDDCDREILSKSRIKEEE